MKIFDFGMRLAVRLIVCLNVGFVSNFRFANRRCNYSTAAECGDIARRRARSARHDCVGEGSVTRSAIQQASDRSGVAEAAGDAVHHDGHPPRVVLGNRFDSAPESLDRQRPERFREFLQIEPRPHHCAEIRRAGVDFMVRSTPEHGFGCPRPNPPELSLKLLCRQRELVLHCLGIREAFHCWRKHQHRRIFFQRCAGARVVGSLELGELAQRNVSSQQVDVRCNVESKPAFASVSCKFAHHRTRSLKPFSRCVPDRYQDGTRVILR